MEFDNGSEFGVLDWGSCLVLHCMINDFDDCFAKARL